MHLSVTFPNTDGFMEGYSTAGCCPVPNSLWKADMGVYLEILRKSALEAFMSQPVVGSVSTAGCARNSGRQILPHSVVVCTACSWRAPPHPSNPNGSSGLRWCWPAETGLGFAASFLSFTAFQPQTSQWLLVCTCRQPERDFLSA